VREKLAKHVGKSPRLGLKGEWSLGLPDNEEKGKDSYRGVIKMVWVNGILIT